MSGAERRKGAAGELEVAAIFRRFGFDCDRVPNSGGLRIKGDLHGELPVHVEVKRHEVARPWLWHEQASSEAPAGVPWLVAFRRSRSSWLALCELEQLARLLAIADVCRQAMGAAEFDEIAGFWHRIDELLNLL